MLGRGQAARSKESCNPNSSGNVLSAEPNLLFRALRLAWGSLGTARFYVVAAFGIILVLAAIGLWHLIAPRNQPASSTSAASPSNTPAANNKAVARVAPGIQLTSPSATPAAPELERAIAITDVTETERRGPRGEPFIVATIGMTARTTADKDNIEIRVLFFDLDRNNEMRPTDAQVTYQWLTPIRDWTDPAPKYLAATYLQRRLFRRSPEQLHYGGFVVRIYCDGKLQDERSKPEALIASLRSNAAPPATADATTPEPPTPAADASVSRPRNVATEKPAPSPTQSPSPAESQVATANEPPLPYGKPIP